MVTAGAKRGKTCALTFASDWLILGGEASKKTKEPTRRYKQYLTLFAK